MSPSFVRTAIGNCPRYNIDMNQYPLGVYQLAYCPCNMRPVRAHRTWRRLLRTFVYVIGLHADQFGNNWTKKIPRTAGDYHKSSEILACVWVIFGNLRVIFGSVRAIFGSNQVIFGNLQKYSGDIRKSSELSGGSSEIFKSLGESSEIFRRFRVAFDNLQKVNSFNFIG